MNNQIVIEATQKWLQEVVIGFNLCPFAAKPFRMDAIRYLVVQSTDVEEGLTRIVEECIRLENEKTIETTLLIYPNSLGDFETYLHFLGMANQLLSLQGHEGTYQIASFHPNYQFEGSSEDDPSNFTNRSIYPMIHLLREESLDKAIDTHPDTAQIPYDNQAFCQERGYLFMEQARLNCLPSLQDKPTHDN